MFCRDSRSSAPGPCSFRSCCSGTGRQRADPAQSCFRLSLGRNAMHPIESKTLRLEPLTVAHAEEMFEPLSATALYDYTPGAPPASVAALRDRYLKLERGTSADRGQVWLNWIIRLTSGRCVGFVQ